jgi:hypothetical protein
MVEDSTLKVLFGEKEVETLREKKKSAKAKLDAVTAALAEAQRSHSRAVREYREIKRKLAWASQMRGV